MKQIFNAFKNLEDEDFRLLAIIEAGLRRRRYVPKEEILAHSKMDLADLDYYLGRADRLRLLEKCGQPYEGYRLLPRGYDFLALNALTRRNRVDAIGDRIAVGKESEVYEAVEDGGSSIVIKFHRLGMTSFHKVKSLRVYLAGKRHYSWIYASRLAAQREFEALQLLKDVLPVPCPVDYNRNAVVMERIEGCELVEADLDEPEEARERLLSYIDEALEAGVIHGDLSEFNVLFDGEGFILIDWPQWVSPSRPQARFLLNRDRENIVRFFEKRYGIGDGQR